MKITVTEMQVKELNLTLEVKGGDGYEIMGVVDEPSMIDIRSSSVTTTITRRQIDGLPRRP